MVLVSNMRVSFYLALAIGICLRFDAFALDSCPRPKVSKETIIRSKESIAHGAKLLYMRNVDRAHDCYNLCCNEELCDTAVMHYKRVYEAADSKEEVQKQCYLFACGEPSVCTFDQHEKYAVIELPGRGKNLFPPTPYYLATSKNAALDHTARPEDGHAYITECPPGVPMPMCSEDLCEKNKCLGYPGAVCRMNFCGGCFFDFFDASGNKLNCALEEGAYNTTALKSKQESVSSSKTNEQAVFVNTDDYGTPPKDAFLEADRRKAANGRSEADSDPYFNTERRKWLDARSEEPAYTKIVKPGRKDEDRELVNAKPKAVSINTGTLMSLPLLVALLVCVILLIIVIYRLKCAKRGKPRKFQVDDGDYLINGMYL